MMKICIVGGGASGLVAAITLARRNKDAEIIILEKNKKLGKKILASGNGRCNLTNEACDKAQESLRFFSSIGVVCKVEEKGRVYPVNGRASSVVAALSREVKKLGIKVLLDCNVLAVSKLSDKGENGGKFEIEYEYKLTKGKMSADKVVIASGGKAGPEFGTTGDSYTLLRKLGHSITPTYPGLCSVDILDYPKDLKGVRQEVRAKLYLKDKLVKEEVGEVQFTETGLSGICIMNLSNYISLAGNIKFSDYKIVLDLLNADYCYATGKCESCNPNIIWSVVHEKLAKDVLKKCGLELSEYDDISSISLEKKNEIVEALKNYSFTVKQTSGWKNAQVSCGGVSMDELSDSLESKIVSGLYIAGEALDFAGLCGGFNLQHAWETGIAIGEAIEV